MDDLYDLIKSYFPDENVQKIFIDENEMKFDDN